jgi:hypothetical protein
MNQNPSPFQDQYKDQEKIKISNKDNKDIKDNKYNENENSNINKLDHLIDSISLILNQINLNQKESKINHDAILKSINLKLLSYESYTSNENLYLTKGKLIRKRK